MSAAGYFLIGELTCGGIAAVEADTEAAAWPLAASLRASGYAAVKVYQYPEMVEVHEPQPEYLVIFDDGVHQWSVSLQTDGTGWNSSWQLEAFQVFVRSEDGFRRLTDEEVKAQA